jgi:hypothetical protein
VDSANIQAEEQNIDYADADHIEVEVLVRNVACDTDLQAYDSDPGYIIVTEDRGTNCPSVRGSIRRKPPTGQGEGKKEMQNGGRRQNQNDENTAVEVHGKVKRWSKLLKYSMPAKYSVLAAEREAQLSSHKTMAKDRKSLKDKMKENDFVTFLTERRAVSESRFRVMDTIGNPNVLVRAKSRSDQNLADETWTSGIASGSIKDLRSKFEESSCIPSTLEETTVDKTEIKDTTHEHHESQDTTVKADTGNTGTNVHGATELSMLPPHKPEEHAEQLCVASSGSSSSKINESSPDSGAEEKGKNQSMLENDEKEKKKGKEKKKKPCETCKTEQEHKEHKKEKRRIKKEKAERKKEKEITKKNTMKTKPVLEKSATRSQDSPIINSQKVTGDNFFQKLFLKEEYERPKSERLSRPRKPDKSKRPMVLRSSQPTLGVYLKGKQAVTDSIFRQYDQLEKYLENQTLPKGVIQCDDFSEKLSLFEGRNSILPRSLSNLDRVPSRKSSKERPGSCLSNRSLSQERRCTSLPRPGSSMSQRSDSSYLMDQLEYRNYVYEMVHSTPKNPRFSKLQQYFNTLDKVVRLESASSSMDIHKLKSDDIVDFDTWRDMRKKEKAQDELSTLLSDLRQAQKEREFHFRPKEVESVRWTGDSRLRGRDKSVEHLRNLFTKMAHTENNTLLPIPSKTNFPHYWQQPSQLGSTGGEPFLKASKTKLDENKFTTFPQSRNIQSPYKILNSQRSRSSLSMDQVSSLKHQLNEILSNRTSNASSRTSSRSPSRADYSIDVSEKSKANTLNRLGLFVKPMPEIVKRSVQEAQKNLDQAVQHRSRSKEDEERLKISRTINAELMKRVNFQEQNLGQQGEITTSKVKFDTKDAKIPMRFQSDMVKDVPGSKRDVSPRTCYSLEDKQNYEQHEHNEGSDFILVLSDNESKNKQVTEIIDRWATSAEDTDADEVKRIDARRKKRGKLSGLLSSQSSDSISSGTSIHTVIFQGRNTKINTEINSKSVIHEKSFEEIRKSFENIKEPEKHVMPSVSLKPELEKEVQEIPPNKVKEIRKSFENMPLPDPPPPEQLKLLSRELVADMPPKLPMRSSSFQRAIRGLAIVVNNPPVPPPPPPILKSKTTAAENKTLGGKNSPQSKSASSIPEACTKDEGYATFPNTPRKGTTGSNMGRHVTYLEKSYIPEKSISNIDLTDTESNSLDETFGKMHDKVHSLCDSYDGGHYHNFRKSGSPNRGTSTVPADPTRYSRAYLLVAKSGDVRQKLEKYEENYGHVAKSLPSVDPTYIRNKITDTSKVVIKNQEIANVSFIKSRLEKAASRKPDDIFDYCGARFTKQKLRHFCKKMGHSRIIAKMGMLQRAAKIEDDDGFEKLNNRSLAEAEYITKYQRGEVDTKKSTFEWRKNHDEVEENLLNKPRNQQSVVAFSWSRRFDKDMPAPAGAYSEAQKHNQFRKYYGYHPTEAPSVPLRNKSRMYLQPSSRTAYPEVPPYCSPPPYHRQPCMDSSEKWQPHSLPLSQDASQHYSTLMTNSIQKDSRSRPALVSRKGPDI